MRFLKYISLPLLALLFQNCDHSVDDMSITNGSADFSSFIAIGDNYTAGYTNGALGKKGQLVSYPNLIAQQLKLVGGGEFKQPLTADDKSVGTTVLPNGNLNGYYALQAVGSSFKPFPSDGNREIFATMIGSDAPFNNTGVPGAKSFHLLTPLFGDYTKGPGNYNPFYTRFASQPVKSTVLGDALAAVPTFFTLWIGLNDVLTYALAGGEADAITPAASFNVYIDKIVTPLIAQSPKGAIASIPSLEVLPYFSYITSKGYNEFLIVDETAEKGIRTINKNEKILLSASDSIQLAKWGQSETKPIPAKFILDETELNSINSAISAYNQTLKTIAEKNGLAYVDMNAYFNTLPSVIHVDGTSYSNAFITGGFFSLDGIDPTPRGAAMIANEFIKSINNQYDAVIPSVNINDYDCNLFP